MTGRSATTNRASADYAELMDQQLDDLRFHENRANQHRAVLTAFLGSQLVRTVLSPDTFPEYRRLVELAVEQGFDMFNGEQLALSLLRDQIKLQTAQLENVRLQKVLDDASECLRQTAELQARVNSQSEQAEAHRAKQTSKAASARRQMEKDSAEASRFLAAADTLESDLQALGFSDSLRHEALVEAHLSNQHLAAERQALLADLAKFDGLSPDLLEARNQVAQLEQQVAQLQAEIQEQGRFLM